MPCPIGDGGWELEVSAFYDPSASRRFGSDLFGEFQFGPYPNQPPPAPQWVDWSDQVGDLTFTRGLFEPDVNDATDVLDFEVLDPEGIILRWDPDSYVAGPQINTPVRVVLWEPGGLVEHRLLTASINVISEIHTAQYRTLNILALGAKVETRTGLLPQTFESTSIGARLDDVLAQIGWPYAVGAYPPSFLTIDLLRDPEIRDEADELDAYEIMQQATLSAGYVTSTDVFGGLTFLPIVPQSPPPPTKFIADCDGVGVDAVSTAQEWRSDTEGILNVVQVLSVDPTASAEAVDVTSVDRWGRRSRGFGFPISVANKTKTDAQAIADLVLATTAFQINRVAAVEFHTLTDPRWFDMLAGIALGDTYNVHKSVPGSVNMEIGIIGYTITATNSHLEGTLHVGRSRYPFQP